MYESITLQSVPVPSIGMEDLYCYDAMLLTSHLTGISFAKNSCTLLRTQLFGTASRICEVY